MIFKCCWVSFQQSVHFEHVEVWLFIFYDWSLSDLPLASGKILYPNHMVFPFRLWPFWHLRGKIEMFTKTSNLTRIKVQIDSPAVGSVWNIHSAHSASSWSFPLEFLRVLPKSVLFRDQPTIWGEFICPVLWLSPFWDLSQFPAALAILTPSYDIPRELDCIFPP